MHNKMCDILLRLGHGPKRLFCKPGHDAGTIVIHLGVKRFIFLCLSAVPYPEKTMASTHLDALQVGQIATQHKV